MRVTRTKRRRKVKERRPHYTKETGHDRRIVSVPGGLWQVQVLRTEEQCPCCEGRKHGRHEWDRWELCKRPTTKKIALSQLHYTHLRGNPATV